MPTDSIVTGGFTVLTGGMDGGKDASLIGKDQVAAATNFTFRNGLATTRPPIQNQLLTFDTAVTQSRFTGRFQGAMFYNAEAGKGDNGFIVSINGNLFRIQMGLQNTVSEITPSQTVQTTADFTVPLVGVSFTIFLTSSDPITVGQNLTIDSGSYTVTFVQPGNVFATYNGNAANPTVTAGTSVIDAASGDAIIAYLGNSPAAELIYLFQAENYAIVLGGQSKTIIYDGAIARQAGVGELPSGLIGLYAWGRIWISLNDSRTFVAGDLVYDPQGGGTAALNFRDSILKMSDNNFLNGGGAFTVPNNAGPITSMFALATQDTSLGIGPILIGTTNSIISVNAPVDRNTWQNLQYPIQTISLLDYGPQGPRATASVNGDEWYRAVNAIRSFIVARRDINIWGNTPMSHEVDELLSNDSTDLLYFSSVVLFDNKVFCTISPQFNQNGITHNGAVVLNLDSLSDLREKLPPCWDGVLTGVKILQFVKGTINDEERCFMFVLNNTAIELWEVLKDGQGYYDQYTITDGINTSITRTAIKAFLHTRRDGMGNSSQLKALTTAELFVDELVDQVTINVFFRPDEYPAWFPWTVINLCASVSQCSITQTGGGSGSCQVWQMGQKQYAARIMLPSPAEACNVLSGRPGTWGYEFQWRIEVIGHCRIRKFRPYAMVKSDKLYGDCPQTQECRAFPACDTNWFDYDARLDAVPIVPFTLSGNPPQFDISNPGTIRQYGGVSQIFDPDTALWYTVTIQNGQITLDPQGQP